MCRCVRQRYASHTREVENSRGKLLVPWNGWLQLNMRGVLLSHGYSLAARVDRRRPKFEGGARKGKWNDCGGSERWNFARVALRCSRGCIGRLGGRIHMPHLRLVFMGLAALAGLFRRRWSHR